jgi:hypothetical protein
MLGNVVTSSPTESPTLSHSLVASFKASRQCRLKSPLKRVLAFQDYESSMSFTSSHMKIALEHLQYGKLLHDIHTYIHTYIQASQ